MPPAESPASLLDEVMPRWDFSERHSTFVNASPATAFAALRELTASEVHLLGPLMALRSLPGRFRSRSRDALGNPLRTTGPRPLIDVFLAAGFCELAVAPDSEYVAGAIGRFWRPAGNRPIAIPDAAAFTEFVAPGHAKAAFNFTVAAEGSGSRLATETRIVATSPQARRSFGRYWLVIRAGSGLIRRSLLAAIRRRAERAAAFGR